MQNSGCHPYSPAELESRFQELRAQRARARQLFHCYAPDGEPDELDEADDAYLAYYDEMGLEEN
jgi:hypothetical protein